MRLALAQGADGVELDVRLCASGEVIVLHDPDLERIAGVALRAADASLDDLRSADLGAGERVPRLDEAIDLVIGAGALLNIELKSDVPDEDALVAKVVERVLARSAHMREKVLFSSFSLHICELLHAALPSMPTALLFGRTQREPPPWANVIHPGESLVSARAVESWHARGLLVNTWTVNDEKRAVELMQAGVDGIVTDDVPLVLAALAAAQARSTS
jgi:glycerophosphoryl diester phosphodiesterase